MSKFKNTEKLIPGFGNIYKLHVIMLKSLKKFINTLELHYFKMNAML